MHNDVDHQENVVESDGCNPYDKLSLKLNDDAKEKSESEFQLEAKEEDLVLAAKLGKTLLEKNEELTVEKSRIYRKYEVELF